MIRESKVKEDEKLLLEYISEKANDVIDFMRRNKITGYRAAFDIEIDSPLKDGGKYDYKHCRAITFDGDEVSRIATYASNHVTGKMDYLVFNYGNEEE